MKESVSARKNRATQLLRVLAQTYPDAHCELNYSGPLELLIATILSARCTDRQVNLVTPDLFKKYPQASDYAQADLKILANDIKKIGLYRNKAKNIQACCHKLAERHHGQVPQTMEELVLLDGVGRKTANVILSNAFGLNYGLVVDTHVSRLAARLKLSRAKNPEAIERDLMKLVPQEKWGWFSHCLIWHGRRRCYARKPDCRHCEIARLCPSAGSC